MPRSIIPDIIRQHGTDRPDLVCDLLRYRDRMKANPQALLDSLDREDEQRTINAYHRAAARESTFLRGGGGVGVQGAGVKPPACGPSGPAAADSNPQDYLIHEPNCATPAHQATAAHDLDDHTQGVEDRCDRFAGAKLQGFEIARWLESEHRREDQLHPSMDELAHDLRRCGRVLHFHEYADLGENRLVAAKFCQRPLLCPCCAIRRAAKMMRRYAPLLLDAINTEALDPWLVTFTVKDGPDLVERLRHLKNAMRRVNEDARRYRTWIETGLGRRRAATPWADVAGAVYSIEVKRGRNSGQWHPHAHAVALLPTGKTLDQEQLSEHWRRVTGDSFIVDCRRFRSADRLRGVADVDDALGDLVGDLVEVIKYAVKFSGMEPADVYHAFARVREHRMRLLGRLGCLHGWGLDPSYLDAPLEADDLPFVEAIATYVGDDGYSIERVQGAPRKSTLVEDESCAVPF